MRDSIRAKIVKVCEAKIAAKGPDVGVSFLLFLPTRMMTLNCSWK